MCASCPGDAPQHPTVRSTSPWSSTWTGSIRPRAPGLRRVAGSGFRSRAHRWQHRVHARMSAGILDSVRRRSTEGRANKRAPGTARMPTCRRAHPGQRRARASGASSGRSRRPPRSDRAAAPDSSAAEPRRGALRKARTRLRRSRSRRGTRPTTPDCTSPTTAGRTTSHRSARQTLPRVAPAPTTSGRTTRGRRSCPSWPRPATRARSSSPGSRSA